MGTKTCRCLFKKEDPTNLSLDKASDEKHHEKPKESTQRRFSGKNLVPPKAQPLADSVLKVEPEVDYNQAEEFTASKKFGPGLKDKRQNIAENVPGEAESTQRQTLRELNELPDYSNPETRAAEQRLGSFKFDPQLESDTGDLEEKPPIELDNGAIYMGQWDKYGKREGRGIQIWPDGSKYTGYWRNDKANGKGRLIHADGDVYEGQWLNDKAHGHGTYIHVDGSLYKGEWKEDKQHGYGVETWADGATYEGNYEHGKKHGIGKFKWVDGSTYEGQFFYNNIHGNGVYVWSDGRRYEGDWKNNKMDGKGVFTWSDGRKYVGEYRNDKKHGQGEFMWPDGRRYVGGWSEGRQHGEGIYKAADGKPRRGQWRDGKRIRWITDEDSDNTQLLSQRLFCCQKKIEYRCWYLCIEGQNNALDKIVHIQK
eukprot:TRINITY_DN1691_c0_g1_i1.p2 TRINITY_DN1691_c0_g1~~TRINITY_DN1691_c0_g1_i1.p2  ORF type:complete len:424 (+),score=44.61 TRINITY_DN1691_c0_g1_i1:5377-6648(+)